MEKLFLDTNIILDLLMDRAPYSDDIGELIIESQKRSIRLCVSAVTVTDANYIIGRSEGTRSANVKTQKILDLVSVENVGESAVRKASESAFADFEDGVQNYCAQETGHRIIVTRNVKDYKSSELAIMTPTEALIRVREEE